MPPKSVSSKAECVKVVIRCRPMNDKETSDGHERVVDMDSKLGLVEVKAKTGEPPKQFTFDAVYDWNSKQRDLYDESFRDLVQAVLEGFNGTIFAYGQTGTGKTFTMQGVKNDPDLKGVIPNSFDHIFSHISRSQNQEFLVRASYLEIYMEEIRDLLSADQNKRLELKERPDTGVYIKDLSSFVTKSCKEIEHVMNRGNQNRAVGATNMNEQSSRSHAIFIITVECSEMGIDSKSHIRVGKLNLVDLAGSERQSKTGSEGDRLKEATKINLSLSALGNVISALVDGKSTHIPYRDSKLTRLLQDSLGGNAKTVMVANIGPASYNLDETVTTLRYANRAKNIKNKPKINEDPKDALLREFQEELARLKDQLNSRGGGGGGVGGKKRHKKRRGPDGELISDDEGSGGEGGGEGDEEDYMNQQMAKLEEEKQAILNNKSLIAGEKEKLLADMNEKEQRIQREKETKDVLQKKIQAMESKLLTGGKNIIDHTNEQQRALEQRRLEIAEQQRKEREMQQKLEEQEESAVNIQETYNSLHQEVEVKTKKLKKLFAKLQAVKGEIRDVQEEHVRERQELEQTQNELTRDLKLKMLIIENFIPVDEKTRTLERAEYDEEEQTWKLKMLTKGGSDTLAKRPASAVPDRKWPVSVFGKRMSALSGGFRFAGENILSLELDMPNRTTRDYEGPSIAPRIQAVLDAAMEDEGDIDIEERRKPKKNANQNKALNHRKKEQELYPSSRGLVPK